MQFSPSPSRDARGLFLPGARPGPGRPRKEPRSPGARILFNLIYEASSGYLERYPEAPLEDVVEAASCLAARARGARKRAAR